MIFGCLLHVSPMLGSVVNKAVSAFVLQMQQIVSTFVQLRRECSKFQKEQPIYDLNFPQHRQNGRNAICGSFPGSRATSLHPSLWFKSLPQTQFPFWTFPRGNCLICLLKVKSLKANQEGCRCCLQAVQLSSCFYTKLRSRIRISFS